MANADQEIEVKFMVHDLPGVADRLVALGARLVGERVHETNLRFDTPQRALSQARQALRLRQDVDSRLTFKGPIRPGEEASVRQEIEFSVSDFAAARRFLEALGYIVVVTYEKYRTTYELGEMLVTLDELPYGDFIEIEGAGSGSDEQAIISALRTTAAALNLTWESRSSASYLALFDHLCQARSLSARHLSFDDLRGIKVQPDDLGLRYADLPA